MIRRLIIILAMALSGCVTSQNVGDVVSVGAVKPNLVAWHGREVVVSGWIRNCRGGLSLCSINSAPIGQNTKRGPSLIIGYVAEIEPKLQNANGRRVLLKARVTDICVEFCTDRGPNLIPIQLIKVY